MLAATPLFAAIGGRIRCVRMMAGLSQADLAARIGMERTSITNIEAGTQQARLETLYRIARVLDVPIYLFIPENSDERDDHEHVA